MFDLADIAFNMAAGNYWEIHRRVGGYDLDQRSLNALLKDLTAHFMRIHKCFLCASTNASR